jgi:cyclic pyranopterin phosphate synthase
MWYLCLYATEGIDLRRSLRSGASTEAIGGILRATWGQRRDRGAEDRLAGGARTPLIPLDRLRRDPHLEMHTRGG